MTDFNALYQQGLYLSPGEQDLLLAALSSNNRPSKQQQSTSRSKSESNPDSTPGHASSGSFSTSPGFDRQAHFDSLKYEESPFLDFNPELDWDFQGSEDLIGDLPESAPPEEYEGGEKRKDIDGEDDDKNEASGKKRRESVDKIAKKPGRKPLTSEPTSKRKAQNRAAQRAFRERKEKHLKDLETKVDELQKASDGANQENGLLRAQVERLQVELREYRKRLSWVTSGNALSAINSYPGNTNRLNRLSNNELMFDFPKFGDLPGARIFNDGALAKSNQNNAKEDQPGARIPGVLNRDSFAQPAKNSSPVKQSNSPSLQGIAAAKSSAASPVFPNGPTQHTPPALSAYEFRQTASLHDTSNSDSPSSSSDSHRSQFLSSSGTSPEPSAQSPATKPKEASSNHTCTYSTIDGEASFCAQLGMACGNISNPVPAVRHKSEDITSTPSQPTSNDNVQGFDFLAQQNGGQFDPLLFGDWREPQDAILSQDFNTFFDDAFPLPDLGSPSHNLTEVGARQQPKKSILEEIDSKLDEEVVPGEDKSQMLSCTKIWDRLQSMEKFRNGEIDVDNLCSELRTKARCSEGGVVVNQKDVDDIIGRV
ncbi:hypothetical protein P175DRAFT_0440206 [Aspergillus ochraceoroseus IBT 24754]|uniref:BZIP domain-containing protein n=2 Tax=Aspergillus ochraceoroseus TaxID=138278 RepID=A0A2T5LUW8_9EURO|nr:uncharacterized protein P175DRAFT_0440206 [Aspergillus ochraceoroseus IBT 24754]KKK14482.1 hypothetical protein AOCH_002458 [Aspergillus ochraceoroseus]PTU20074.1 hypothetical protein P175DRAFT_0440206 [Aspergillus ochraceoroseus IBT 24754]